MTIYTYQVVSNKPLALGTGIGNMPWIIHDRNGYGNLTVRDRIQTARSNGAAAGDGHIVSMELVAREGSDETVGY